MANNLRFGSLHEQILLTLLLLVLSKSDLCTETATILNKKAGNSKTAIGIKCDVTDLESIPEAFKAVELALGPVDVLVNNAGIAVDGLLVRMKDEDMQKVVTTNLLAPLAFSREASKSMMRRKSGGDIVMIGSLVGDVGNVGQVVYASTKAGLIGATKSMALELGKKGIRTNMVSPGFVETDMTSGLTEAQLKGGSGGGKVRILAPEDVASEVMKLLRSANSNGEILTLGSL